MLTFELPKPPKKCTVCALYQMLKIAHKINVKNVLKDISKIAPEQLN